MTTESLAAEVGEKGKEAGEWMGEEEEGTEAWKGEVPAEEVAEEEAMTPETAAAEAVA